ncbi:forkhead box protein N1 [Xenentodon cancila]
MLYSPKFSPSSSSQSQTSAPQTKAGRDACFPQRESSTLSLRTAALNRRHSTDGITEQGPVNRFHPYHRQFSDGVRENAGCLQHCSSSFRSLEEVCSPDAHSHGSDMPATWDQYSDGIQSSYSELPTASLESPHFLSQRYQSYGSLSPLQQVSAKLYPSDDLPNSSKYSPQSRSSQPHQESATHSLFPKPIYSYSILIFMALKNSKTGSLPVSEIYSFMTEHFPYFRTAPDGWKNSVRHNLSLNKCFEKVENKNGNTSRKGCLWALNPAKVEKMQEELHKWRRKDPLTVRRSMARPEDLDRLLGEKLDKFRSLPPYTNMTSFSRVGSIYSTTSSSDAPPQLQSACQPIQPSQHAHIQPQQPRNLPLTATCPSNSYSLFSPCGQLPAADVTSAPGSLTSPIAGKMPPVYSAALLAEYSAGPRGMQDMLLEGDASYDIDTLNPSLTDLQLQGNLWEELREDSLVSEPQVTTTSAMSTFDHHIQTNCLQVAPPLGHTSLGTTGEHYKEVYEMADADRSCWNDLHPVSYSGVENLSGYLTSCTTSISLM